jgi:hypothetical protein
MALLALNIHHKYDRSGTRLAFPPLRLSFPKINRASFPAQALVFSLVAHVSLMGWVLFGPSLLGDSTPPQRQETTKELASSDQVIYLPRLGGGSEGSGYAGGGSLIRRKGSPVPPAHGTQGVSYPGPQAILSDPAQPTNKFQTIMRPAVKNPPILRAFVSAPNIVQTTDAGPLAAPELNKLARPSPTALIAPNALKQPRANSIAAPAILSASNEQPKLALPTGAPQAPSLPATEMKAPKAAGARAGDSAAPQYSPVPTSGPDMQNLVSLSPNPAPAAPSSALPVGEARGRFAISPDASPTSAAVEAGSKATSSALGPTAIGNEPEAPAGNAAGQEQAGVTNGSVRAAIGGAGGTGTNTGSQIGAGNGGTGAGRGKGSATGAAVGSGAGISTGAGSGAGVAQGGGAFPGVTIGGSNAATAASTRLAPQMVYPVPAIEISKLRRNATVVTTGAAGGGGLGAYGVLNCGKIYTIFLPMPGTNWTMQYCLGAAAAAASPAPDSHSAVIHIQAPLVPPDPDIDSRFDFQRLPIPPEKAHKLIMLKGTLKEDGTVEDLQVYQGIVPQMDEAARLAFSRWKFKPAMRDGNPVPVQLLIGIPPEVVGAGQK